jgi:hypothetical protein
MGNSTGVRGVILIKFLAWEFFAFAPPEKIPGYAPVHYIGLHIAKAQL